MQEASEKVSTEDKKGSQQQENEESSEDEEEDKTVAWVHFVSKNNFVRCMHTLGCVQL